VSLPGMMATLIFVLLFPFPIFFSFLFSYFFLCPSFFFSSFLSRIKAKADGNSPSFEVSLFAAE
jgi:hypothetical protein